MNILNAINKSAFIDLINSGKRLSDRGLYDYRKVCVSKNVIKSAAGSALARIGNTQVLAAVKFDIGEPYPDRPDQGVFITNSEFVPFANPDFDPGPPNENSIELARVVDRGIRSSGIIDVKGFVLEDDKVLMMFLDLWSLDDQGNLTDTAALAAMSAIMNAKVPKYEDGALVRQGKLQKLKVKGIVTAHTFGKLAGHTFVDMSADEQGAAEAKITLSVMDDKIVAVQKSGSGAFTKDEVLSLMDIAFKKHSELKKELK